MAFGERDSSETEQFWGVFFFFPLFQSQKLINSLCQTAIIGCRDPIQDLSYTSKGCAPFYKLCQRASRQSPVDGTVQALHLYETLKFYDHIY